MSIYDALTERNADFSVGEVAEAVRETEQEAVIALENLVGEGRAFVLTDGRYLSDGAAERLRQTARRVLAAFHRKEPYRLSLPTDELRAPLSKAAIVQDFGALAIFLVAQGVVVAEEGGLRLPEHTVTMPERWRNAADEMLAVYRAARFDPPAPGNFQANYPRDTNVRAILTILAETGELVPLSNDLYITREAFDEALEYVRRLAETPDGATVATLRDATNSSRKVIAPLLEYLDARKITRRIGDKRVLSMEF